MSIHLHIVTPSRNLLSVTCDDVVLPGYDGEIGILSEHTQLINRLGAGIVRIQGAKSDTPSRLAISGGVVEIAHNQVTVLADDAVLPSEINKSKLADEQAKLSKDLVGLTDESVNRDELFIRQRWLTAQSDLVQN